MENMRQTIWKSVKKYFNAMPYKQDEEETIRDITSGISFHGANLWILIFAIFIASLGLNVNSTAVIIGAMLISPLMGPITGMGLSIGINDLELFKRSMKNFLVMTVISIITATIYFLLTPLKGAQSELLARTSPSLYDVFIALMGGGAGILAIATKGKSNVIPGVAIATALMPPLCTAGYGLASAHWQYFFGAIYLFFINTIFIGFSTFMGVKLFHFKPKRFATPERMQKVHRTITLILVATMIPAAYLTIGVTRQSFRNTALNHFVKRELSMSGTQILQKEITPADSTISLVAVGKVIPDSTIKAAEAKLDDYKLRGFRLRIIQGAQSDSLLFANESVGRTSLSSGETNDQLVQQNAQIHQLEAQLAAYQQPEQLAIDMRGELRAMYPGVASISISRVVEAKTDTTKPARYTLAMVKTTGNLAPADRQRLQKWLKLRAKADSLRLVLNP